MQVFCKTINLREFGIHPGRGTPKNKTWKVKTHNVVILRTIICFLEF